MDTIPTHDRFGLVMIRGVLYQIVDIGLRMLEPKELYGCQGVPDDYIIDHDCCGKPISRSEQVRKCGNMVCPPIPAALVKENLPELCVGHTVKEKELRTILTGGMTELITFKNKDKKSFDARLYWDADKKRIALRFDENTPVETGINCPICGSPLNKTKYGYSCSKHVNKEEGCKFIIGSIAGVLIDEKQLYKLVNTGKTDLLTGFKPKEKGKQPFSAYLVWKPDEEKIAFSFPDHDRTKEKSNYMCPVCHQHNLLKTFYNYNCECGFKMNFVIAERTIPDEQIKKLFLRGETDLITGFYSSRKRKMFSAKLVIEGKEVKFSFPKKKE